MLCRKRESYIKMKTAIYRFEDPLENFKIRIKIREVFAMSKY